MSPRYALFALCAALVACATTTPFASNFPNGGDRLKLALARVKAAPHAAQAPVVVGVVEQPRAVFAYDLAAERLLFEQPIEAVALPFVAGAFVVVPEERKVTVRRLSDGRVVESFSRDGMQLVGADGDGALTAIALSTGGAMNVRSRLVLMRGDSISADRKLERELGAPAVLGGLAIVPHHRVHVSILDAGGAELARVRVQDDVTSQAFTQDGEVYFGQRGAILLDDATEQGVEHGAHYFRPALKVKLPGNPALLPDTSVPPPPLESALHRVSLSFAPAAASSGVTLADDSLYLTFYRQLFALAPDGTRAHWVHETESDVVGVRAVPGGFLAVESSGTVTALDARGQVRFKTELGRSPIAARIRAEHFDRGEAQTEPAQLVIQLERAARNTDTRLVPSRAFAAALLGGLDGEEAARALIALCGEEGTPARVQSEACDALARRSQSSDAVLTALEQHANFLEGVRPPPVGALALAALHAGDRRAAPKLLAHLADPATPAEALGPLLSALGALGDAASATPIATFLRLYHADAIDDVFEQGLAEATVALVKLDPKRARSVLEPIADDALARAGVRAAAQRALNELAAAAKADADKEQGKQKENEDEADDAESSEGGDADEPAAGPPEFLTTGHVEDALSPVRVELSRCVKEAPEHPASARLVLVIEGDGKVSEVRALPTSVQACAEPLVRSSSFPVTKSGKRTVMSYTVER